MREAIERVAWELDQELQQAIRRADSSNSMHNWSLYLGSKIAYEDAITRLKEVLKAHDDEAAFIKSLGPDKEKA